MFGLWSWQDILGKGPLWRDGERTGRRCPRCKRHFPKLRNEASGQTVPVGGFVCEHCGCKMDEFGNELSFPADLHNPESW